MSYPRRSLGDLPTDPIDSGIPGFTPEEGAPSGAASSPSGSIDWNALIGQGITDVTQLLAPGTPSPVPIYLPSQPASAALSSPLVYVALAVVFYALSRGKR